jgi:hypothetical protein
MIHAPLKPSTSRRFFGHSVKNSSGRTTTQHVAPFADENMLIKESPAQMANFASVPSFDRPTMTHVVTQRIGM